MPPIGLAPEYRAGATRATRRRRRGVTRPQQFCALSRLVKNWKTTGCDDRAQREKPGRGQRGFTLIELLVVLAILGMLAAIAVPQVLKYLGRAKDDVVKVQSQAIGTSLDLFLLDVGRYPTDQEGLQALGLGAARHRPVAWSLCDKASSLIDPWGHPYVYRQPGQQGARLRSLFARPRRQRPRHRRPARLRPRRR